MMYEVGTQHMSMADGCQRQDGVKGNAARMEEQQMPFFRTNCSPGLPQQVNERGIKVYPMAHNS
ncbi:MAG: hypothetical protein HFG83_03630 [Dorea sp.]|nr:hypothetical protein [Dorea sp.]